MVINYMFVRNSRLFRTLFFELEYHVQVHCPSTAGFIALLLHLFPSVKRFRLHRSWQASAMESLWGMIDSGVCNFQRCGLPYFRGGAQWQVCFHLFVHECFGPRAQLWTLTSPPRCSRKPYPGKNVPNNSLIITRRCSIVWLATVSSSFWKPTLPLLLFAGGRK